MILERLEFLEACSTICHKVSLVFFVAAFVLYTATHQTGCDFNQDSSCSVDLEKCPSQDKFYFHREKRCYCPFYQEGEENWSCVGILHHCHPSVAVLFGIGIILVFLPLAMTGTRLILRAITTVIVFFFSVLFSGLVTCVICIWGAYLHIVDLIRGSSEEEHVITVSLNAEEPPNNV